MKLNNFFVALALSSGVLTLAAPLPLGGLGDMLRAMVKAGRNGETSVGFIPHETYTFQREARAGEEGRGGFRTVPLPETFIPHKTSNLQREGEEGTGGLRTVRPPRYRAPPRRRTRYQSPLPGSREQFTLAPLPPNRPTYPTHSEAVRGEDILGSPPRSDETIYFDSYDSLGSRRPTAP
ncbi:uncharacterized protein UTRI_06543 [Ustilago trichophora]|uniref:Uncharacterized protein n=1 Tax=Ustilago trichophora TaxID=86804 RepID=A0A5C3ELC3_9BASI|nr:uncharacterized protein UTRI_06543 [Ustilago trichophora]